MAATSVDRECLKQAGEIRELPVAASTTILAGTFVALNSSGYVVELTNVSTVKFLGIAAEAVDNSTGSNGDLRVKIYAKGTFKMIGSGLAVTDVSKPAYAADNQTVQLTETNQLVGYVDRYESTTAAWINIDNAVYKNTLEADGNLVSQPVAASTTIAIGDFVAVNSTGYLVRASATAAVRFVGVARTAANNSGGSDGDLSSLVDTKGVYDATCSSLTQADVGKPVFATAAQTVSLTPDGVCVGRLENYSSATVAKVRIDAILSNLFADQQTEYVDAPVAASTAIDAGDLVALNATGYLVTADDATARRFAGVAKQTADNSAGIDGALNCIVAVSGVHNMTCSGLTQADVGKKCYATADTTVSLTPGIICCGVLERHVSATIAAVRIDAQVNEAGNTGVGAGRIFTVGGYQHVIGSSTKYIMDGLELPVRCRVISMWMQLVTAPGGSDTVTATITDGTTTATCVATGAAVHAENKSITAVPLLANTDIDITVVDSATTGAGASVIVVLQEV